MYIFLSSHNYMKRQLIQTAQSQSLTTLKTDASPCRFVRNISSSEELSNAPKECRICLSGDVSVQNPFVSPCGCSGSVKHVHHQCLKTWYQTKMLQISQREEQQSVICEMCRQQIKAEIELRSEYKSKEEMCQTIGENKVLLFVCMFIMVVTLVMGIFSLVWIIIEAKSGFQGVAASVETVMVASMAVSICICVGMSCHLRSFCIKTCASVKFPQSA